MKACTISAASTAKPVTESSVSACLHACTPRWTASAVLAVTLLAGCTTPDPSQPVSSTLPEIAARTAPSASRPYRISIGDEIEVRFFYTDELNQVAVVPPDGRIAMQLIGSVTASGQTPDELETELKDRYRGILRRPEVSVAIRQYAPQRVYVGGQVREPGEVELSGNLTLLQAVVRSGGFTKDAQLNSVLLLRYNLDQPAQVYRLDIGSYLKRAQHPGTPDPSAEACRLLDSAQCDPAAESYNVAADAALEPFDVVFVPQTVISSVADFFGRYVNVIAPFYQNFGLTLTYNLDPEVQVVQ